MVNNIVEAEWHVTMLCNVVDNLEQCGQSLQRVDDFLPCIAAH